MDRKSIEINQGIIAYEDSGEGPLVVCVPGMGDLRQEYRFLAEVLVNEGYRVIQMDVRGHGESSTNWDDFSVAGIGSDIVELIRNVNAGPAIIIGTSMAAGAAVWAAAEAPDLVARLVLISPFVRGESSTASRILYSLLFSRPWGPSLWKKYYASLYPTAKPADFIGYLKKLGDNLKEAGRMEALKSMMLASKKASEERLGKVNSPSLILVGTKDPDFKNPEKHAMEVSESVKGEFHLIPGAGHYPHVEMRKETSRLILEFLSGAKNAR